MQTFHFKKLYKHHTEGMSIDAIVTHASRGYERRIDELRHEEQRDEHRVVIDLWILQLFFKWIGRWHDV